MSGIPNDGRRSLWEALARLCDAITQRIAERKVGWFQSLLAKLHAPRLSGRRWVLILLAALAMGGMATGISAPAAICFVVIIYLLDPITDLVTDWRRRIASQAEQDSQKTQFERRIKMIRQELAQDEPELPLRSLEDDDGGEA